MALHRIQVTSSELKMMLPALRSSMTTHRPLRRSSAFNILALCVVRSGRRPLLLSERRAAVRRPPARAATYAPGGGRPPWVTTTRPSRATTGACPGSRGPSSECPKIPVHYRRAKFRPQWALMPLSFLQMPACPCHKPLRHESVFS